VNLHRFLSETFFSLMNIKVDSLESSCDLQVTLYWVWIYLKISSIKLYNSLKVCISGSFIKLHYIGQGCLVVSVQDQYSEVSGFDLNTTAVIENGKQKKSVSIVTTSYPSTLIESAPEMTCIRIDYKILLLQICCTLVRCAAWTIKYYRCY